ncbi:MAG: ParB/RepB/Spo0J family partition protein [Bacillota bacterium]
MSKRRLGKGLGAFIPGGESFITEDSGTGAVELPLEKINANPNQPRKDFDEEKLREMAETITNYGVIQPIIVQKRGDAYILVAGERRLRAAAMAGLKTIPALVKDYPAEQLMAIALIENLQREDLNPIEEANALQLLIQEYGITQEELAAKLGKSRSAIANAIRLLSLDPLVQNYLEQGILTPGQARPLLALTEGERQRGLASEIIARQLNVRQVEKLLRALKKKKNVRKAIGKTPEVGELLIAELEEKLRKQYGTKVLIKRYGQEGKIELSFYSDEDLERIAGILLWEKKDEE